MSGIGGRIKELRKFLKMSQDDFVLNIDITRSHLSKIETGVATPSDKVLKYIIKEYFLNEEWLKEGKGNIRKDVPLTPEMIKETIHEDDLNYKNARHFSGRLRIEVSALGEHIKSLNRFESTYYKEVTEHFKDSILFNVMRMYKNALIDLQSALSNELKNIDKNKLKTNYIRFPLITDLERSALNILRSLDRESLKDLYVLLASKGTRLSKNKRESLKKDINELQKAAK